MDKINGDFFNQFDYFPRIKYKNFILKPQRWTVSKQEIDKLAKFSDVELLAGINELRDKREIVWYLLMSILKRLIVYNLPRVANYKR